MNWPKPQRSVLSLDVVVVKARQGRATNEHLLTDFTLAVRDSFNPEVLHTIGRAHSGLSEAEIKELSAHLIDRTISQRGRVRTVIPDTVIEIAFDSVQPSRLYCSGFALKFPWIKAIRRDKRPQEIDSIEDARALMIN